MSCTRVQVDVSRAIDEDGDLMAFEAHLSVCSDCGEFATASLEIGERYRRQVVQGIDRLRRGTPPAAMSRSRARWLIPLASCLIVLLSLPQRSVSTLPAIPTPTATARVPLFDDARLDPVDLQLLTWAGEVPLPRRLDQEYPWGLSFESEPSITLPSSLRF